MAFWWKHLLSFVFPAFCASCQVPLSQDPKSSFCFECYAKISFIAGTVCQICGRPLPDGGRHCYFCRKMRSSPVVIRAVGTYKGVLKNSVLRLKFEGAVHLSKALAELMNKTWLQTPELRQSQVIVPVPLHWARRLSRGYNQSELLAHELGQRLDLPVSSRALHRQRWTRPQYRLRRQARQKNLTSAFGSGRRPDVTDRVVLLVDDVCTTGATLQECAKTLRRAGAASVLALVVARQC